MSKNCLREARRGEANCLGKLLQYYGNYLKLLVTTHLDAKLRTRCSPSDIVQESYFEAHRDFEKFQGQTAAEFLAWLRKILVNNMAREVEKHILSAKRDVRREVRLDGMQAALERSAARLESVFIDRGPSPSSRADRHEHVGRAGQPPGRTSRPIIAKCSCCATAKGWPSKTSPGRWDARPARCGCCGCGPSAKSASR